MSPILFNFRYLKGNYTRNAISLKNVSPESPDYTDSIYIITLETAYLSYAL